ncbi:ATPase [soil metagenome]
MQSETNYRELIGKLDAFIRKYYKNQLIRGGIYAFTLLLGFYIVVTLLESFAWFNTSIRSVLFYLYITGTAIIVWRLVLIPLFKLYHLGSVISHTDAAKIVGEHFTGIKDKLLNTLQLHDQASLQSDQLDLINASIQQKSAELRPVPFTAAIDFRNNKRYLKLAAIPALVLIVILIGAPSLITDATKRLLDHSKTFSKPAPFDFTIQNTKLRVTQFDDFTILVKLTGKEIPQEVYVESGDQSFRLEKENVVTFRYTFRNVQATMDFNLLADGYTSESYTLEVVPNPIVTNFSVKLDYPAYLGKKNEELKNTGDLLIPAGTRVSWDFGTQNTTLLRLRFTDSTYILNNSDQHHAYQFSKKMMQSSVYNIRSSNAFMDSRDSMEYSIVVIPDQFPAVQVEEQKDSASYQRIYFRGIARDDYGLSKMQFKYRFFKREGEEVNETPQSQNISINKNSTQEQFFHYWDLSSMNIKPGDELEYYFEVWDNDGVHGPKSVRSQSSVFKAPSSEELSEDKENKNKALKDEMAESLQKARELQKTMNEINRDLMNKKELTYEDRKKIADALKQQKDLGQKLDEIKKQNEQNNKKQNELRKEDTELAEKQKQLQALFEKLMTPEMKKMMEELDKLMAQMDKQKVQELMDKMKLDNKDLEKQLDRTLELFKQMELEEKMKETAENLQQLSKEEEKLSEKSEDKKADTEQLKDKQDELNKKFDEIQKSIDDIEKKNEELEYSKDLKDFDKEQEDIEKKMEESKEQLKEGKPQKASKSQKEAAQKMDDLAQKIQSQQKKEQEEQAEEDEQALRALLENLIRFSFDQENLMEDLKTIDVNNPRYLKLSQAQRKLKDDSKVIEDSLLALSKRVAQISSMVNEQITDINDNLEKAQSFLQDRMVPNARSNQQYVMTATNNLALMLSESLDQMQQQMAQSKPSNGSCKKPGKGKPGPTAGDVRKMQEKLSQQLKDAKDKMQKGNKPNGNKPGSGKPSEGGQGMSEELARMAAQQEALRNALQQLDQSDNKDGQGKLGDLQKIMQQMEETEKDIVNKRISDMTLNRQQDILTRLLESEKAEREREQEERRESNEGKDLVRTPPQFEEYKKLKLRETELLKTIPPSFTTFYKNLVNSYFQSIED